MAIYREIRRKSREISKISYNHLFAIFIGVQKFPKSKGKIQGLLHANEDAHEMFELFLKRKQSKEG